MGDVRSIIEGRVEQTAVTLDRLAREAARRTILTALEVAVQEYVASLASEIDEHTESVTAGRPSPIPAIVVKAHLALG